MRAKFLCFTGLTCFIGHGLTLIQGPTLIYWAVVLPGIFLHELMHWIMAYILLGNPDTFSVIPEFDNLGQMLSLGHVTASINWFNAASIGLAPLLLVPITLLCIIWAAKTRNIAMSIAWSYFAACAWASCVPSSQDFSIALAVYTSWPLALLIIGSTFFVSYRIVRKVLL